MRTCSVTPSGTGDGGAGMLLPARDGLLPERISMNDGSSRGMPGENVSDRICVKREYVDSPNSLVYKFEQLAASRQRREKGAW